MVELKKGDKIRTKGLGGVVDHYGIFVGDLSGGGPWVMHNNKPRGVQRITLAAFLNGNQPVLRRVTDDPAAQEAIVRRALAMEGWSYDPVFFNCEDFANYAQIGVAYSGQVFGWLLGAIAVLMAIRPFIERKSR